MLGKVRKIINSGYEMYSDAIDNIIAGKADAVHVWCDGRNKVYSVNVDGKMMVVKQFVHITIVNRLVYNYLRKSKARRSYENAIKLCDKGFLTPTPVAYADISDNGLYKTGYYISELLDWPDIVEYHSSAANTPERDNLVASFVNYTCKLHESNILHRDYNPRNILVGKDGDTYKFALVDINRMTFGRKPNMRESMKCIQQLGVPASHMGQLIDDYASRRGFDPDESALFAFLERIKYRRKKQFLKALKSMFW